MYLVNFDILQVLIKLYKTSECIGKSQEKNSIILAQLIEFIQINFGYFYIVNDVDATKSSS